METVNELLEKLKPEDAYLAFTSKEFAAVANKKEKWYGTQYVEQPVDRCDTHLHTHAHANTTRMLPRVKTC
eukprot:2726365-Rhodomonas_salina.2